MTMKTKSYHIRKVKQMNVAAVSISRIVEAHSYIRIYDREKLPESKNFTLRGAICMQIKSRDWQNPMSLSAKYAAYVRNVMW